MSGRFEPEKRYQLSIHPTALTDTRGRLLDLEGASRMSFYYPRKPKYLTWQRSSGTVERFGPQSVPMDGRGFDRADLRIYAIDALDRTWWPFPARAVSVDESQRPPGPGEEPDRRIEPYYTPSMDSVKAHLTALGSPLLSRIVDLPIDRKGSAHTFGLDLAPYLTALSGKERPGHYLVGVRRLDGSSERSWMRLEVTDLSLSVVEEPREVRFFVTSLRSGKPVAGAHVRVEGVFAQDGSSRWETFFEGTSDEAGAARWTPPGAVPRVSRTLRRVTVEKDGDVMLIDPDRPPERFQNDRWQRGRSGGWLAWTVNQSLSSRGAHEQTLCHIFTERPVYRPEDQVHIAGYVRTRYQGAIRSASGAYQVEIRGSGDQSWSAPIDLTSGGAFHHVFSEANLPTGMYTATLMTAMRGYLCQVPFRMEAYRIPTFEVRLFASDEVPIDQAFDVTLTGSYYAGGPVAGRPVRWRVTQFPYTWSPPRPLPGFVYSTDSRYSRMGTFQSTPALGREATTDERGGASLDLNPAVEPTAQPRTYVVEATITGADDQTVTATKQVRAIPPFVLGLKAPRFLERADRIRPEIVMVDAKGQPIAGQEVTVRLIHRAWHSHLQASDFSDGAAKYITDVVDEKLLEKKATTKSAPIPIDLPIEETGVYLVELEARDRLGRAQVVAVDLFAAGDQPMSWKKPEDRVFEVDSDRDAYDPGETAKFVLQSPFQSARALVVVEGPEKNDYRWLDVEKGVATFSHAVARNEVPRLPVHFVLMRGRIGSAGPIQGTDLGKPITMAATKWITVNPVEHRVEVALEHAEKAQPGQKVQMKISLSDTKKRPLSGEVILWLVDQAVLALGTEQALDPLPAFITPVQTYLTVGDTRNGVFGRLPLVENPGGDTGEEEKEAGPEGLLDKVTVRKNFESVPVFLPAVKVGPSGQTTVTITLPDNLTNFKVRAKAVSGMDRFGSAKSTIAVRLPVIVQPALPRFVRSGDRVTAGGLARVVEGEGGPGSAEISVKGARVQGSRAGTIELVQNRPLPLRFPLVIDSPLFERDPKKHPHLSVTLGVERKKDGAKDAFSVMVPLEPDRGVERRRIMETLAVGQRLQIEGLQEPIREGTGRRTVLISDQPALVRMAAGLDFLLEYPHGTTEARVSRARAFLAAKQLHDVVALPVDDETIDRGVDETLAWIGQVIDANGLCSYWPGSRGYVSLTAWVLDFMVEAERSGHRVDPQVRQTLMASLERALRSDYAYFISGEVWAERVYALEALAHAGRFTPAYAAELARKADYLNLESTAGVVQAFLAAGKRSDAAIDPLSRRMWDGLIFRLHQGKEIYGGLQERHGARSSLILPSETRTVAEMVRALDLVDGKQEKLRLLTDALVTLGRDDGWGTTNANASAMLALAQRFDASRETESHRVVVKVGGKSQTLELGPKQHFARWSTDRIEPMEIAVSGGTEPVIVRIETSCVPKAPGSAIEPESRGFVVTREQLRVKEGGPPERIRIEEASKTIALAIGDVVEEHVQVVNPKDRHYAAISVPLAAGMEPLNASLATAPPEARPTGRNTAAPTYLAFLDDRVTYYFDTLPKGTYDFYFRTRAQSEGTFTQPPATGEMLYDNTVAGRSPGARVVVTRKE